MSLSLVNVYVVWFFSAAIYRTERNLRNAPVAKLPFTVQKLVKERIGLVIERSATKLMTIPVCPFKLLVKIPTKTHAHACSFSRTHSNEQRQRFKETGNLASKPFLALHRFTRPGEGHSCNLPRGSRLSTILSRLKSKYSTAGRWANRSISLTLGRSNL